MEHSGQIAFNSFNTQLLSLRIKFLDIYFSIIKRKIRLKMSKSEKILISYMLLVIIIIIHHLAQHKY